MKNKYGIGFFVVMIIAFVLIAGAYQSSYQRSKELAQSKVTEEKTEKAATSLEPSVATEGQALKDDCFYLMEVNGYVVVYLSDKKTPYEYTDILYDELPGTLREEIKNGKYIKDTEALYGFLENYSS